MQQVEGWDLFQNLYSI